MSSEISHINEGINSRLWVNEKKSEDRTVEELNNKIGKVLNKLRPRVINYSLIKMLKTENKIIHSPSVLPSEWWYYGLEHGQHIGFYRLRTLNYLANKFDLYLISDGISRHFFSKKKIFLYCLAYFGLFIKQISKVIKFRNEIKNLVRSPVNLK